MGRRLGSLGPLAAASLLLAALLLQLHPEAGVGAARTLAPSGRSSSTTATCRDERGDPVDWFAVLKFPRGPEYAYTDSNSASLGFRKSPYTLDSASDGAVASTLATVYSGDSSVGYVQYNDEWPNDDKKGTGAHAKGVIGFDSGSERGFWLVHSVPRFPEFASKGSYPGLPDNEYTYGQSMLCISTDLDALDSVAAQLLIAYPWTYDASIPSELASDLPNMKLLAAANHRDPYAEQHITTITSNGGQDFATFYKSPHWGSDKYLYEDMVEPYWRTGMMWETWMNGINPDPTFCSNSGDYDWDSVNIRYLNVAGEEWKETQDHSKWGVGMPGGSAKVVCIGDINRQESQNNRGGGTTCLEHSGLWQAFSDVVTKYDEC